MPTIEWSDEQLLSLAPDRLEQLRRNAISKGAVTLAERIALIQTKRVPQRAGGASSPVIGFHFKCDSDYEVTPTADGRFWSGVWVVDGDLCQPAIELGGYVALHSAKREPSYRQGTLIDWKVEKRTKGKTAIGVSFLVEPFAEQLNWFGNASGEKGYRRLSDQPVWVPKHPLPVTS